MIRPEMRRAALATFPARTPLTVVAPARADFAALLRDRNDPAAALAELHEVATAGTALDPTTPHLVLEGLDDLDEPVAFLAGLRRRTPEARIFALVSNAAHVGSLAGFYAGLPIAQAHPLVPEEIAPLFSAAGWKVLAIKNLIDESIPPASSLPFAVIAGAIAFNLVEPAMHERCRNAGFLVIADIDDAQ
jgi:hypothetical protein